MLSMLNYKKLTLLASSLTLVLGSGSLASAQSSNYAPGIAFNNEPSNFTIEMASPAPAPAASLGSVSLAKGPEATDPYKEPPQGKITMETLATPSAKELQNRATVEDQRYPATNDSNGRGAFTPASSQDKPSFTFENQNASELENHNLGPADAGTTVGVLNGSYGNERIQEVSVPILTSFDNAILDGFKSLESGITLGLGQSKNLSIDEVAPAVRSFTTDADGNLVLRFSLPMAESILKKQGSTSWKGLSNPVLVWMVGLDGQSMNLVSGQNLSSFAQAIMAATPDYKYRLMFPILDLEEMQKVKVNTILDHQDEVLAQASERYGADYFIAAAISSVPNESSITFKWNLFNRGGEVIAQSAVSGLIDEVASLGAGDIARALMTYQANLTEQETPSAIRQNNVDIDMLGPGEGFVRMRIANVKSLQDLQHIRQALVTYGFDGDVRIIGFDDNMLVIEIATNSNADNLAGTMRHAGEFQYLSPWVFSFTNNEYIRPQRMTNLGPANKSRPNSQIHPEDVTPAHRVNLKDARDVGQGNGLPNRNSPAIQGRAL